jgi:hypothetical protein
MKKRINTFNKSIPIFDKYKRGGCVCRIDANGDIDSIFKDLEVAFCRKGLIKMRPKPKVIFVMGGPGAGKGTQCQMLLDKYPNLDSYSTGDLLRSKVKEGTEESAQLKEKMSKGELISSDYVVGLMEGYMQNS